MQLLSDTSLTLTTNSGANTTSVSATRKRPAIQDTNRNILLRKLRKNNIKTLETDSNGNNSVTKLKVRRQFVVTCNASGQLTVQAPANETFQLHQILIILQLFLIIIVEVVVQMEILLI